NRFDAIENSLVALKRRGFAPEVIVDGGANIGNFARMARRIFADATIHLIEPQPACQQALQRLSRAEGFVLHATALVSPDCVRFLGYVHDTFLVYSPIATSCSLLRSVGKGSLLWSWKQNLPQSQA